MSTIHTVMVAADLSRYSLPTAQYAAKLATDLDADLLFVNVINQRDIDSVQSIMVNYATFDYERFINERIKERTDHLTELITKAEADPATTRSIVRIGVPYHKLLEVIDEETPDLLIMATKGRSDLADVVMGSCARAMFRRCPIPMLTIRGDKFFDL